MSINPGLVVGALVKATSSWRMAVAFVSLLLQIKLGQPRDPVCPQGMLFDRTHVTVTLHMCLSLGEGEGDGCCLFFLFLFYASHCMSLLVTSCNTYCAVNKRPCVGFVSSFFFYSTCF